MEIYAKNDGDLDFELSCPKEQIEKWHQL